MFSFQWLTFIVFFPLFAYADNACIVDYGNLFSNLMAGKQVCLFNIPQNDLSLSFLAMIFGSVGNSGLVGGGNPLVSQIFYIYNTGILLITSTLIAYSTFLTVMATSQDGSSMGGNSKGMLNPYVVIRTVGGASLLIPSFSGYSGMQVMVMYVVVQGVGFADTMWASAINYIQQTGGSVVATTSSTQNTNLTTLVSPNGLIDNLYQSSLCWAANSLLYPNATCTASCLGNNPNASCSSASSPLSPPATGQNPCALVFSSSTSPQTTGASNPGQNNYYYPANTPTSSQSMIFPYGCGVYSFTWPVDSDNPYTSIMQSAMTQIVSLMYSAAQAAISQPQSIIESYVTTPSSNYTLNGVVCSGGSQCIYPVISSSLGGCTSTNCSMATTYVSAASLYYQYANYVYQLQSCLSTGQCPAPTQWTDTTINQGWLSAGMYYYNIVQLQTENNPFIYGNNSSPQTSIPPSSNMYVGSLATQSTIAGISPLSNISVNDANMNYETYAQAIAYNMQCLVSTSSNCYMSNSNVTTTPSTIASSAVTIVKNMDIPAVGTFTPTATDQMYQQALQSMFSLLESIDTGQYISLLPSSIASTMGFGNMDPCMMIMPFARFNRMVLGGSIRALLGLTVDFWPTTGDSTHCQGTFDGALRGQVSSIISPAGSLCPVKYYAPDACIANQGACTAQGLSGCMNGYGMFPSLYAAANGGYIDPVYSTSRIGLQLMAIAINYWVDTTQDVFNAIIASAWIFFGISLPLQMAADIAAGSLFAIAPLAGGLIYALMEVGISIMKIFFEMSKAVLEMYLPLGASLTSIIFGLGVVMGIYVPFMPFMLFLFGVIGWIMAVIEAMVAAPLVALGITHPEGNDLMGKSEQAVMLLLGVFVRPVTMILGLIFAMNLAQIAVQILDYGFLFVFAEISQLNSSFSYVTNGIIMLGAMVVYAYVLMTVIDQAYSLIYQVPDKILRWIGGPQDTSSAAQMANQVKGQVQQVGGKAGDAGSQVTGSGTSIGAQSPSGSQYKPSKPKPAASAETKAE